MMDIPLTISRIHPDATFGWRGDYTPDDAANYDNLDWRDERYRKPTYQELQAEWQAYLLEEQVREQASLDKQAVRDRLATLDLEVLASSAEGAALADLITYLGIQS